MCYPFSGLISPDSPNHHSILKISLNSTFGESCEVSSPLQTPFCGGRLMETQVANRESFCTDP